MNAAFTDSDPARSAGSPGNRAHGCARPGLISTATFSPGASGRGIRGHHVQRVDATFGTGEIFFFGFAKPQGAQTQRIHAEDGQIAQCVRRPPPAPAQRGRSCSASARTSCEFRASWRSGHGRRAGRPVPSPRSDRDRNNDTGPPARDPHPASRNYCGSRSMPSIAASRRKREMVLNSPLWPMTSKG